MDSIDRRKPFDFINRPYQLIVDDLNSGRIPQLYERMCYILWCINVEELKHPYSKKPRVRLLKILYGLVNDLTNDEFERLTGIGNARFNY